jgi:hypothetical protein
MRLISSLFSKLAAWYYIFFAAAASGVVAFKGFLYAHLMAVNDYALINYYLLFVGVGVLVVGSGVLIRCHSELPLLTKCEPKLKGFVSKVKAVGALYWVFVSMAVISYSIFKDVNVYVALLSLMQVLLMFLFTVDVVVIKSHHRFLEYARSLFVRNCVIAVAGLTIAYLMADARFAIATEVLISAGLYSSALWRWLRSFTAPNASFFADCLRFSPLTLLGVILQYADRLIAANIMTSEQFAKFSYLSLSAMIALSIQQLVNARVITVLPAICARSPRAGFLYVMKISLALTAGLFFILSIVLWLLQSSWFSARWVDVSFEVCAVFVLSALLRVTDFYNSYLVVMARRSLLLNIQLVTLIVFALSFAWYHDSASQSLLAFMRVATFGFFIGLIILVFLSWRVGVAKSNI